MCLEMVKWGLFIYKMEWGVGVAGNLGVSMYNIGVRLCEVCLHLRLFVKGWAFGLSTRLELV